MINVLLECMNCMSFVHDSGLLAEVLLFLVTLGVTFSFGTEYLSIIEGEPPKSVCVTMEGTTAIDLDYNITDIPITAFSEWSRAHNTQCWKNW